jgi:TolA-binding protein
MRPTRLIFSGFVLAVLGGEAVASEYYLYTPSPVSKEQVAEKGKEDIAVQEITVVKGDCLSRISRRFTGKGAYYPQILLFNDIKNPNLIHTGQTLRIPLPLRAKATHAEHVQPSVGTTPATEEHNASVAAAVPTAAADTAAPAVSSLKPAKSKRLKRSTKTGKHLVTPPADPEQTLFSQGVKAYKSGACTAAVKHFNRFLANHPNSPLAADAALYRADCYLKQAGE